MGNKPTNYWQSWNNLENELNEIISNEYRDKNGNLIKEKGDFPTETKLDKIGKGVIRHGVHHHGGFILVRKKMGYDTKDLAKKEIDSNRIKEALFTE